jgi:iron complex outermembrane receptor protein
MLPFDRLQKIKGEIMNASSNCSRPAGALAAVLAACVLIPVARGQNAGASSTPNTPSVTAAGESTGLALQTVVVTGTPIALKQFDAPYSVSTMNSADIAQKAPDSIVDLLRGIPGIVVENSGGEGGGENTVIRGLPYAGFRLLDLLVDGLPLFESNYERQLQIDELYRVDLGTSSVQAVRGGTAPLFSNNAAGGVVNFITNHGTETPEHEVALTTDSDAERRVDVLSSGPVSDRLLYSVAGFYRQDDGLRDPGFPDADKGGQLQVGGTYILGDRGKVTADVRYLNDRNIFYSDIPLSNPYTGASLAGLIDPHYGTLDSASMQFTDIKTLGSGGSVVDLKRNLADGINPRVLTETLGFHYDAGGGWILNDTARYTDGHVGFNAIFNGTPINAATYLSSRMAAATAVFPTATSLRYVKAGTSTAFDPAATQNLIIPDTWNTTDTKYTEVMNDLRVIKHIDTGALGSHQVTLGVSLGRYTFQSMSLNNTILNDVKTQPDTLDVQALDGSGNVVGMLTDGGFASFGAQLAGNVHGLATAIYGAETWHITDAWQVDVGARYVTRSEHGYRGILGSGGAVSGPLADRTINGVIGYAPYTKNYHDTSWTAGTFYSINDHVNVFARYTNTFSLPKLSDMWTNNNCGTYGVMPNCQPVPTLVIHLGEIGIKTALRNVQVFVTGFWSHLSNFNNSTYVVDTNPASPTFEQLVNQNLIIQTTTTGVELEASWRPVHYFQLDGSGVYQRPFIDGGEPFNTGYSAADLVGKIQPRAPKVTLSLEPALDFPVFGRSARIFGTFYYESVRYQDNVDTGVLPSFWTLGLGAYVQLTDVLGFKVQGVNLTNSAGLTEGNARGAVANDLIPADATVGRPIFGRAWSATLTARF